MLRCVRFPAILLSLWVLAAPAARAQITFTLTGVGAAAYPNVSVFFDAKDRNGVHIGSFLPSDFTVIEDGVARPVVSVSCPPPRTPPLSITIAIDVSYSMSIAGRMNNAKVAATQLVRSLSFPPAQTGIITFDDTTRIYLPYSNDTTTIIGAISALATNATGGTDFVGAFNDSVTGAIDFTKNRPGDRYIIFLTDGVQNITTAQEQSIIMGANAAGIHIYSLTMSGGQNNFALRRIATATGGAWFENVTTQQLAEDAFRQIGDRVYLYDPCELVYRTTGCDPSRNIDVTVTKLGSTVTRSTSFTVPASSIVTLEPSQMMVDFGIVPAGQTRTADLVLTAQNGPVTVSSITSPLTFFAIVSWGGSAPPFSLGPGQSRTLRVQFTAPDTTRWSVPLSIQSDAPCVKQVVLAGGRYIPDPLRLVQPNGGEVLFSGSSYQIKWTGVPSAQAVTLEYSTNAGASWLSVTPNAYSGSTPWTVPNTPSTTCLGLVRTNERRDPSRDVSWLPLQPSDVNDIAFAPAGAMLAAALNDGRIKLFVPSTGSIIDILSGHAGGAHALRFSADSRWLATSGSDGRVKIWSASTGALVQDLGGHSGLVHSVAFSQDGRYFASADAGVIIVRDVSDWSIARTINGSTMADGALAFHPTGAWLASASGSNVLLLSPVSGAVLRTLSGHTAPVRAIAVSTDGSTIASGGDDRSIRVWETKSWQLLNALGGHTSGVTSVALSGAGLFVVSASRDRTIRVWDVNTGATKQTFVGHTSDVLAARIEAQTGLVASSGLDRTIRLWGYTAPLADKSDSLWSIITPSTEVRASTPQFADLTCPGDSSTGIVTVVNGGNQQITLTGAAITGAGQAAFALAPGSSMPPPRTLRPGDSTQLRIAFSPGASGTYQATLEISTDAPSIPRLDVPLDGHRDSSNIVALPDTIDVGERYACTVPVRAALLMVNTGTVAATIDSIACTIPGVINFGGTLPRTLEAGASDTVWVTVHPVAAGPFDGTVTFRTLPCGPLQQVRITGAFAPSTPIAAPAAVVFGFTSLGDTSYQSLTIANPTGTPMSLDAAQLVTGDYFVAAPDAGSFPVTIGPHDSTRVVLGFSPLSEGTLRDTLACSVSTPCADGVRVPLEGTSARKPAIAFRGGEFSSLLCPDVLSADSTVTLRNAGGETLSVDSLAVTGTNASDFRLLTTAPLSIAPGDSVDVKLRFAPTGTGLRTAMLFVKSNSSTQPTLLVPLAGRKDSAALAVSPAGIDAGLQYECTLPMKRTITIRNTGTVQQTVTVDTALGYPGVVSVGAGSALSIAPGDSAVIEILLRGGMVGHISAAVRIAGMPCAPRAVVPFDASIESSRPGLSATLMDFGTIGAGGTATRSVVLTNTTSSPMRVDSLDLAATGPFISRTQPAALPVIIPPGGSMTIECSYMPAKDDSVAGRMRCVVATPCPDTLVIDIRGTSRGASSFVSIPELSAEIGTRVRVPVTLTSSANLALTGARSFVAEIVFNRSMLWPEHIVNATGTAGIAVSRDGDSAVVTMTVDQQATPANGVLAELECLVLLGNSDTTPLALRSFRWINGSAAVTTAGGVFHTLGICNAGGQRLIAMPGSVALLRASPNPFNPSTEIAYSLPADMEVQLVILDPIGRRVAIPESGLRSAGVHTVTFTASGLPSGTYLCVLRAGSEQRTLRLVLVK